MATQGQITEADVLAQVRTFIIDNFLYMRPNTALGDDDRLLARRIIDSMGVMEVITFIGEQFGVEVPEQDIREVNLGSLRAIARYVMKQVA